jgi:hypothetical protein
MKVLRVQVERVVRPIRASSRRKDRIREELLGHLTRLYDEELLRTDSPEAAAAAALARFGDPRDLSRDLQDSVPRLERWALCELAPRGWARRRVGESPARYLIRKNCATLSAGGAAIALLALVLWIVRQFHLLPPPRIDSPPIGHAILFMFGVFALQAVAHVGSSLLCERMRQLMELRAAAPTAWLKRPLTWRIAGHAIAVSAIVAVALTAGMLLFNGLVRIPLLPASLLWGISLAAAAACLPLTLMQALSWRAATRRFDDWESLDLDEPSAA